MKPSKKEKNKKKTSFLKKNNENIWRFQKKSVPLHRFSKQRSFEKGFLPTKCLERW